MKIEEKTADRKTTGGKEALNRKRGAQVFYTELTVVS